VEEEEEEEDESSVWESDFLSEIVELDSDEEESSR
jgi:hypothetical protein